MKLSSKSAVIRVFLVFAFAYFLSALLRAVTATLAPTLSQEFGLQAADLGLLAGGYFLGFAAMQLPLGQWLDRYGPRKVVLGLLGVAVLGCLAFAWAWGFYSLLLGRVLCGVGVSACLMAPLTGYRRWMEPTAQMRANSWMLMSGSMGMVASTLPVQWWLPVWGWRSLFVALALLLLLALALLAWQVPVWQVSPGAPAGDVPAADGGAASPPSPPGYAMVWAHPYFRRVAPLAVVTYGGMVAIQTLWAGPWMLNVAGYSAAQMAGGLFGINVAMLCAFWCWGAVNPWLFRRGVTADQLMAWGLPWPLVWLGCIVWLGPQAGAWAWGLFCVGCTSVALAQPALALVFPPAVAGRALSAFNLLIFVGVFVVQWGIGLMLDALQWAGVQGAVAQYRWAMGLFGLCNLGAYLWFAWRGRGDNACETATP